MICEIQIVNKANFGEINNLLSQGRDMDYIARHYHMDLAMAWALRLEGRTDREKFKELGWGFVPGINGILTTVYPVKFM